MQGKFLYEYAIIRIVPRVERGERINAGIILFCKSKDFLGMLYEVNEAKILALEPTADIDKLKNFMAAFQKICCGEKGSGAIGSLKGAERFRWLTAKRSTLIQISKVHPGFTDDPEKQLKILFEKMVL